VSRVGRLPGANPVFGGGEVLGKAIARGLLAATIVSSAVTARAFVDIEMVTVCDLNNAPDTRYGTPGYGAVSHAYQIGKYDVTIGQYCQFLNAVAKTDTYGLYNSNMAMGLPACSIDREGTSGNYTYSSRVNPNYPMNEVSWADAARFCNWLTNDQHTGLQGSGTTEQGSYNLNGATTDVELMAVTRNTNAHYVIPNENEWYKAAYYKSGGAQAGYWKFATRNDSDPSTDFSATGTNNANYNGAYYSKDYLTEVGAFESSFSAYGTFDQSGDVWQWTETTSESSKVVRGGAFNSFGTDAVSSAARIDCYGPSVVSCSFGFRVASVPEPSSLAMVVGIALTALLYWWRKRA
jgi:formylglycine-generating enzyme